MDDGILVSAIEKILKSGMDRVDLLALESNTITAASRLGKPETIIQADAAAVTIRFSKGKRSAVIATDNVDELNEDSFVEKARFAVENSPEEEVGFRPSFSELCKSFDYPDISDEQKVSAEELIANALECEQTALGVKGITNSEGAEASSCRSRIIVMKDDNFYACYKRTVHQLAVVTLAEKDGSLERDWDFSKKIYYSDLKTPEQIAKKAAERTLKKMGAQKISSRKVPVIFDRRIAGRLLGDLLEALNGASVAKGISFLKNKLYRKIFCEGLSVTDSCKVPRGLRSHPFDSDGLECFDLSLITNGTLNSFLLNTRYANMLGLKSTAHAKGFDGISPHNARVENGSVSFEDLLKSIKNGLYVTEVLGRGLNPVTGNYSQGAAGFLIENGEITRPVHEITIAGNFEDMFSDCVVASDLEIETGIDSPSLLINNITVGGT
ncbi:MAG: hypothetical protein LBO73_03575 [Holosporaceae bacterium]|jgi:PmbA protein|nr:hypothetical protein [Holosporaceae bacterium]